MPKKPKKLVIPTGIQLHRGKRSESIGISFYFSGVEYRETLKLPIKQANIDFAANLRGKVLAEIALGTFDYAESFPNSIKSRRSRSVEAAAKANDPRFKCVGQLMDEYLSLRKGKLKLSSYNQYADVTKTHILPRWKDVRVVDIIASDVKAWIGSMTVKSKTVSAILLPFRLAMQHAVDDNLISHNPCDSVKLGSLLSDEQKEKFKPDPFDVDEVIRILNACNCSLEREMFGFALGSGMRPSEYSALTCDNIDLRSGTATVVGTFVDGQYKLYGKTDDALRTVRLTKLAWDAVSSRASSGTQSRLLFPHPKTGERWTGDKQIRGRWQRILKIAGVRYRNPYQTRHTYTSSRLMLGDSAFYLATQLGHIDTNMITKVYGKWIQRSDGTDKLDQLRPLYTEIAQK